MVVMDQFTRRIIGFAAHAGNPDGVAVCQTFNRIIAAVPLPRYLSSDHDPLFEYHRWRANLRVLDVRELKTVPYAPVSHPFVERLIGTIRREFLDHVLFWSLLDLERKLGEFQRYFNDARVHASLGATPIEFAGKSTQTPAWLDDFRWQAHGRGLVELPIAA